MIYSPKFLIAPLIILVVLVVGGGTYYYFQSSKSQSSQGGTKSQAVDLTTSATDTSSSGWQTYQNTDFGVSFLYPPESSLEKSREWDNGLELNIVGHGRYWVRLYKLVPRSNLEEWIKNGTHYNLGMRDWSFERSMINGYESVTARGYDIDCNSSASFISDGKETVVYIFSYYQCLSSPNEDIGHILNSVVFENN